MSSVSASPPEAPLRTGIALTPPDYARLVRRAIFECDKWDPQVEDVPALAPFPLMLARGIWEQLAILAEALAAETLAAETELSHRPELHRVLGLPRRVMAALRQAADRDASPGVARLARFDFHPTADGWRITEVNSDVPGGLNEASGFSRLMAESFPDATLPGDPAAAYAAALLAAGCGSRIALVHATAFSDDHQVMRYLARELAARGARTALISPAQLRWVEGLAQVVGVPWTEPADILVRFFPGEWLPELPAATGWSHWFAGGRTPASNPAAALLTQSKRFPLVWDALRTPLPTWHALLPETRDPREVGWRDGDEWVVKPALGRVGDGVGIAGVTAPGDLKKIVHSVRWHPRHWVAQRRFAATPLTVAGESRYPSIGVFTIGARAVGVYGRVARRALIDSKAQEAAVLLDTGAAP